MTTEGVKLTGIPTVRGLPWAHRGRGVIVNDRKQVVGAFELTGDAIAVVAVVNSLGRLALGKGQ